LCLFLEGLGLGLGQALDHPQIGQQVELAR